MKTTVAILAVVVIAQGVWLYSFTRETRARYALMRAVVIDGLNDLRTTNMALVASMKDEVKEAGLRMRYIASQVRLQPTIPSVPDDIRSQIKANAVAKYPCDLQAQAAYVEEQIDGWRRLNP